MALTRNAQSVRWTVPSPFGVFRATLTWVEMRKRRHEIERLLECEDRMLTDMGITRGDVTEALAKRGDPSFRLRSIAARRRFNSRNRDAL